MRPWIASLIFYLAVFALCEISRFLVTRIVGRKQSRLAEYLLEFVGTIQICAPMFDVNFVLENYGLQGVFVEILFIEVMNAWILRDAIADPCPLIYGFLKGATDGHRMLTVMSVQFAAGYLSFFIAKQYWSMGLHPAHMDILEEECGADLTVTILYGSLVEAAGCLMAKTAEFFLEDQLLDETRQTVVQASISGIITILGIHLTGMYANPIVAWACTFNCGDVPYLAHFMVYWVAPVLAWVIADSFLVKSENPPVANGTEKTIESKKDD